MAPAAPLSERLLKSVANQPLKSMPSHGSIYACESSRTSATLRSNGGHSGGGGGVPALLPDLRPEVVGLPPATAPDCSHSSAALLDLDLAWSLLDSGGVAAGLPSPALLPLSTWAMGMGGTMPFLVSGGVRGGVDDDAGGGVPAGLGRSGTASATSCTGGGGGGSRCWVRVTSAGIEREGGLGCRGLRGAASNSGMPSRLTTSSRLTASLCAAVVAGLRLGSLDRNRSGVAVPTLLEIVDTLDRRALVLSPRFFSCLSISELKSDDTEPTGRRSCSSRHCRSLHATKSPITSRTRSSDKHRGASPASLVVRPCTCP